MCVWIVLPFVQFVLTIIPTHGTATLLLLDAVVQCYNFTEFFHCLFAYSTTPSKLL